MCHLDRNEVGLEEVGFLVDKDDLIKYLLLISYGLLVRIFIYQPLNHWTVD
jgi:hypothetical protein